MKRTILLFAAASLFLSTRAFAQEAWAGDDELSWQEQEQQAQEQQAQEQQAQDEADAEAYRQERGPTFDDFRNDRELSWAGEWIDTPEYGQVWRPTRVDSDWRPYLNGRWERTNLGWAWVSDEPFGWAVYHYGRWAYAGPAGWLWVPGRAWAPAWVAWRWGDGYAGWCPLGPRLAVVEQPAAWVFVGQNQFLEPVRHHAIPHGVTIGQFQGARALPIGRGPHAGPVVAAVQRSTGHAVRPLQIADGASPAAVGASSSRVTVYRPHSAPLGLGPQARGAGPAAQGSGSPSGQGGGVGPGSHPRASGAGGQPPHSYFGGVPGQGILDKHAGPRASRDGSRSRDGSPHVAPPRADGPHGSPPAPHDDGKSLHAMHAAPSGAAQPAPKAH